MRQLLINGCYNQQTFHLLKELGVSCLGLDLRPRSPNLVTFSEMNQIISQERSAKLFLIFENEKLEIIKSSLDLLKHAQVDFILQMRDQKSSDYYHQLPGMIYWMFHPVADWKNILLLNNVKGVILPYKMRDDIQVMPELWNIIEARSLEVVLHVDSIIDLYQLMEQEEISISFDLGEEFQLGYRQMNLDKIKKLQIWREE
ncbi:MAG: hypothetical protein AB7I27_01130 [Bacteriovoracaceae bacterium]